MKKYLGLLMGFALISSSVSSTTSCNIKLFAHKVLNSDISNWDFRQIFEKDTQLQQAISVGKHSVYLNPAPNSTPFIDNKGDYQDLKAVWKADFNDNDSNSHINDPTGLGAYQLDYIADSFIVEYNKIAKHNGGSALKTEESFQKNFEVVYYDGFQSPDKKTGVFTYAGEGDKTPFDRIKKYYLDNYKTEYHVSYNDNLDNSNKPSSLLKTNNLWSMTQKNGGYAVTMQLAGSTMGVNEAATIAFTCDIIIKQDRKEKKNINGVDVEVPVSVDGYWSSDSNTQYSYLKQMVLYQVALPLL